MALDYAFEVVAQLAGVLGSIQIGRLLSLHYCLDCGVDFNHAADLSQEQRGFCFHLLHLIVVSLQNHIELRTLLKHIKPFFLSFAQLLKILSLDLMLELELFEINRKLVSHPVHLLPHSVDISIFLLAFHPRIKLDFLQEVFQCIELNHGDHIHAVLVRESI